MNTFSNVKPIKELFQTYKDSLLSKELTAVGSLVEGDNFAGIFEKHPFGEKPLLVRYCRYIPSKNKMVYGTVEWFEGRNNKGYYCKEDKKVMYPSGIIYARRVRKYVYPSAGLFHNDKYHNKVPSKYLRYNPDTELPKVFEKKWGKRVAAFVLMTLNNQFNYWVSEPLIFSDLHYDSPKSTDLKGKTRCIGQDLIVLLDSLRKGDITKIQQFLASHKDWESLSLSDIIALKSIPPDNNSVSDYMYMSLKRRKKVKLGLSLRRYKEEHDHLVREMNQENLLKVKKQRNYKLNVSDSFKPMPPLEIIRDTKTLAEEGIEQSHCVYSYRNKIDQGQCAIYRGTIQDYRITMELVKYEDKIIIQQIKGKHNQTPPIPVMEYINNLFNNAYKQHETTTKPVHTTVMDFEFI
jgi:hypothetical protein